MDVKIDGKETWGVQLGKLEKHKITTLNGLHINWIDTFFAF